MECIINSVVDEDDFNSFSTRGSTSCVDDDEMVMAGAMEMSVDGSDADTSIASSEVDAAVVAVVNVVAVVVIVMSV